MKVIVKWKGRQKEFVIFYNIGDVVIITNYGARWASQGYTFNNTTFTCHNDIPFNLDDEYLKLSYFTLNELIPDLEWKIIDIGYFVNQEVVDKLFKETLVIRLRDRQYHNMLLLYNPIERDGDMKVVRKVKSHVEEYVINLKD